MSTPQTPAEAIKAAQTAYTNFEVIKANDWSALNHNNNVWRNGHGDPFSMMTTWLCKILNEGSIWDGQLANKGYQKGGSLIDTKQDDISETSYGMSYLAAFRGADSDMEQSYSDAYNDSDKGKLTTDLQNINSDLSLLTDPNNLNFGSATGNPIIDGDYKANTGSQGQIYTAATTLKAQFAQIGTSPTDKWPDLHTFLQDSQSKDDTTGASTVAQLITQNTPTITQATGLVSQTLQEQFGFIKADIQQYLALFQTLIKSINTIYTTFIGNEKSTT